MQSKKLYKSAILGIRMEWKWNKWTKLICSFKLSHMKRNYREVHFPRFSLTQTHIRTTSRGFYTLLQSTLQTFHKKVCWPSPLILSCSICWHIWAWLTSDACELNSLCLMMITSLELGSPFQFFIHIARRSSWSQSHCLLCVFIFNSFNLVTSLDFIVI